ncbi:MAG TPA: hypothetical protein VK879_00155 [Candidatus Sulfomarinibacteraceae bacterium]|nr:hypothetical protein [Candidatus Sulfomarinibacteraceae bacterium]
MQEEQATRTASARQLWFGVAAGPIVWAIYLGVSYTLVALHCQWGFFSFRALGGPGLLLILTAVALVAAAPVLYGAYAAYGNWRAFESKETLQGRVEERQHFLALSGVLLSSLFFLVILVTWIPIFVMGPCAGP